MAYVVLTMITVVFCVAAVAVIVLGLYFEEDREHWSTRLQREAAQRDPRKPFKLGPRPIGFSDFIGRRDGGCPPTSKSEEHP